MKTRDEKHSRRHKELKQHMMYLVQRTRRGQRLFLVLPVYLPTFLLTTHVDPGNDKKWVPLRSRSGAFARRSEIVGSAWALSVRLRLTACGAVARRLVRLVQDLCSRWPSNSFRFRRATLAAGEASKRAASNILPSME
jgi:hypothetical protein